MDALPPFDQPSTEVLLQIEVDLHHQSNESRIALAMSVC